MEEESYSLVQECTDEYYVKNINDNKMEIRMRIPQRFKALWLSKLANLYTTEKEIKEYEYEDK